MCVDGALNYNIIRLPNVQNLVTFARTILHVVDRTINEYAHERLHHRHHVAVFSRRVMIYRAKCTHIT